MVTYTFEAVKKLLEDIPTNEWRPHPINEIGKSYRHNSDFGIVELVNFMGISVVLRSRMGKQLVSFNQFQEPLLTEIYDQTVNRILSAYDQMNREDEKRLEKMLGEYQ